MYDKFEKFGVKVPEILLPAEGTDLAKWAVIACDQYTSQPDYWENVRKEVGAEPSTLKLTFPEIYLKDDDKESRIRDINRTMTQYLDSGTLQPQKPGFILVDRSTPCTASRKGLIIAVDLECYDYRAGSQTLIRATEGTVLDRIPPRVKIRENAGIELPHIMLLIDDPGRTVIEKLFDRKEKYKKLYDFELMQGGGHIKAWKVDDEDSLSMIADSLEKLADPEAFRARYGLDGLSESGACKSVACKSGAGKSVAGKSVAGKSVDSSAAQECPSCAEGVLLFAAGDGNHSLATAKAHWENVKAALLANDPATATDKAGCAQIPEHPARYALVELVNVHDDGLAFEPIHRVLFGINSATVLDRLKNSGNGMSEIEFRLFDSKAAMEEELRNMKSSGTHIIPFILEGSYGLMIVQNPSSNLAVGTLQAVLDKLVSNDAGIEIDYIHGSQVVSELGSKAGCMGFFLPVMSKHDLFRTVILDGVLPRKTFSMGEAEEKRYYMECRRIRLIS